MATQTDVRRIALSLPETEEGDGHFAFSVRTKGKPKGFAWIWLERVAPRKARVPNPAVLAVRVSSLAEKDLMIAAEPDKYFTEPHYNGFPAVLVRLVAVKAAELRMLLTAAWRRRNARNGRPGHQSARSVRQGGVRHDTASGARPPVARLAPAVTPACRWQPRVAASAAPIGPTRYTVDRLNRRQYPKAPLPAAQCRDGDGCAESARALPAARRARPTAPGSARHNARPRHAGSRARSAQACTTA